MSELTKAEAVEVANGVLADLAAAQTALQKIQALEDELVSEIKKRYQKKILELEDQIRNAERALASLWEADGEKLRDTPKGKTATLRNGTLSERLGTVAVVLGNSSDVLLYLRTRGVVKRFTKQPERVVVKSLLRLEPGFVDKAPDEIMHFEQARTLHMKPAKSQVESARNLAAQKVRLGKAIQ